MRLQPVQEPEESFEQFKNQAPPRKPEHVEAARQRAAARARRKAQAALAVDPEPLPVSRVLLADDHAIVRRGVRAMIESDENFEVIGEATNGDEAIELVQELQPDIVVLDISMPGENGLDVTRKLHRVAPQVRILILTMHLNEEVAKECIRAGARAYVVKSDADDDVLNAVRAVREERVFFTPQIEDLYYTGYMDCRPTAPADKNGEPPIERLTPREVEVVKMLCEGFSNKEVASNVGISTRTVESHRNNVMRKLNFQAFSQLVRYAVRKGVVAG